MTETDLRKLLQESESTNLDFKRIQYHFRHDDGTEDKKGKGSFIKDVLSFANTNREDSAFILIGVRDPAHSTKPLVGIPRKQVEDDAHLQQIVSEKTNRPVIFKTDIISLKKPKGRVVQAISIPPCFDNCPFYLKKRFADIAENEVWYRRGSSNTKAKPEDLVRFGRELEKRKGRPDVHYQINSPNAVTGGKRLLTFNLIPENVKPNSSPTDAVLLHHRESALTLVKLSIGLMNKSERSMAKAKVSLSLKQTSPWTGKLVNVEALLGQDMFAQCILDDCEVTREVLLYPGEEKQSACSIVFDTNGKGAVTIHLLISVDGQGIVADETICYKIERRNYHHDFSNYFATLLIWQNEDSLFSWIQQQANTMSRRIGSSRQST